MEKDDALKSLRGNSTFESLVAQARKPTAAAERKK
jgi:hypothetical protein